MKLLALVAATSAALNVALVAAFVSKPDLAPPGLRDYVTRRAHGAEAQAAANAATATKEKKKSGPDVLRDLWSLLQTDDLPTLAQRLRAAGFPPSTIRTIIDAQLQERFAPRMAELRRITDETPYWRLDPVRYGGSGTKFYETYSQISRDRMKALREVLGKDAYAYAGTDPTEAQRRQFGNLSPGKIEMVQRINDDYAEMMSQVRAAMQGITLPEDREKLALLEREKRADLAAVLTPDELADYEMRSSMITMRLRTALSIMDASEAEFRAIYLAHQPHAEILYPTAASGMVFRLNDPTDPRNVATRAIQDELTRTLGADRFAQYQRANDREFQQLYQLTRPENVPYETLVRAHDTRTSAATASTRIMEDPSRSADDKRAALKDLAQDSRTQLLSTLGPKAGPPYVEASQWLSHLEQGRSFSVSPTGSISSRGLPPSTRTPSSTAPKK